MPGATVDVSDRQDIIYWCKKLHCTEHQLREAVNQVGTLPSNVEAYLLQRLQSFEHDPLPPGRRPS